MKLPSWLSNDDPFARVRARTCGQCAQPATCYRISTTNGLSLYQFRCSGCQAEFAVSSMFTRVLTIVTGLFMVVMAPLILVSPDQGPNATAIAAGSFLGGGIALGVATHRIRTARKNPEVR
jgi:RsiW-degrading membrane proteinase PrsW (M82 family)